MMKPNNLISLFEFPGGIHPPENKTQSMQLPLGSLPIPPQLIIPLHQHIGAPAKAIVKVGDSVLAGQLIGAADGTFSANVHASSSGVVSAIGLYPLPHPSGMSGECICIDTDGKHEFIAFESCSHIYEQDRLLLLEKIRAAGVAGLGGAGFPTAVKLNVKSTQKIDTLIINGAECEPYITADDMLMQARAMDIIYGAQLLAHILHNPQRVVIAIEDNKPNAITALQTALAQANVTCTIEIISIPTKYPSGGAKQLTQLITGREIPHGHHSADVGVCCVNVGTAAATWRAIYAGEPLISRITTVVGESLNVQRNLDVLIGTPIEFLLKQQGFDSAKASRVIMGGSMMGFSLKDLRAPVIKTTNCILAPSLKELPPPPPAQACIRCGLCAEVCPASLLPQQLFWYAQAEDVDRLTAHNLFDCIECGACSYVCPSKIPLVQYYRAAKGSIRKHLAAKEKADRARQRFEFRQSRIDKEEAAKEAKRIARKKAADEAKQKLAEKNASVAAQSGASDENLPVTNVVVAAVVKASNLELGFEEQKSKLERMLAAAQNSLESARAPLVPKNPEFPITQEQLVRQQSRIKQAELKLADAEKKLADFLEHKPIPDVTPAIEERVPPSIARAQAKIKQSPQEKLRANLEMLQSRLQKAQEKVEQANAEGSPTANALQLGVTKMQEKIADVQAELDELLKSPPKQPTLEEQNAVADAMERAKARTIALANMNDEEKRADQIKTLEARLQKAKERLARAEAENDQNVAAFKKAVLNIEEKLEGL